MEHEEKPTSWVTKTCLASTSVNPSTLLEEVMADSRCIAFGPIHHYIVGAVLLACYRNDEKDPHRDGQLADDLAELEKRSDCVPGAACARWGVCGAAASAGMAHAIIRGNGPLRAEGWSDGQRMVSRILERIADAGAPRCCKRDSRIAIEEATRTLNELLGCHLETPAERPVCDTMSANTVCLGPACPYHPAYTS